MTNLIAALLVLTFPRVDADLKKFDDTVAQMEAEFAKTPEDPASIPWVKAALHHMVEVDQFTIKFGFVMYEHGYSAEERAYFQPLQAKRYVEGAKRHAARLKPWLTRYGWFTIGRFGAAADDDAWLLVQHDDPEIEFQQRVLATLAELYPKGETRPSNYAYLFDRVAVHGTPPRKQRYGSQGRCVGPAEWQPDPIENEADVDARRAALGMPTMAEYKTWFKDWCK